MMPPKKSKAARGQSTVQETTVPVVAEPVADVATPPKKKRPSETVINEADIVEGKRKRTVPAQDQKLDDWLAEHIEEKEETRISSGDIYNHYLECCVADGVMALEMPLFTRALKAKYPKGYGVKADSPYHDLIKEKKVRKKVVKVKVQAESLQLKMKDIIDAAIRELGNPKKGIRFPAIKKSLAAKYPALRIDLRPMILKKAIDRGVHYGQIIAVRGIGAAGFYRVPLAEGEEEKEEEEEKKKEKEPAKKKESKEGEEKKDEEEGEKGEGEEEGEVKENGEATTGDEKEEAEAPADGKRKTRGADKKVAKGKDAKGKKGKKGAKKAPPKKVYRSFIVHSDPQRIEDCFPMALTFMCDPKVASMGKIKKYFADYYPNVNVEKLKKAVTDGEEKGFWTHISGSGSTGSYQLALDDLDPSTDDNINSKIANSIIASNEPKIASANLIKKYLIEYHADFKVADKPNFYKKALERAQKKGQLRQISGIGATGSFQLPKAFVPTPTQLRGEDDEDYYEQSSDEEAEDSGADSEDEEKIEKMLDDYRDAYVPRPSKRRGHARPGAAGIVPFTKSLAPVGSSRRRRR